jgi:hypothetical protein
LIKISQFVKIFEPEVPQNASIMSRYLDKSQKVSTNLKNLDENLDAAKVWILQILTKQKKKNILTL